jgi:hypothetical protein
MLGAQSPQGFETLDGHSQAGDAPDPCGAHPRHHSERRQELRDIANLRHDEAS